MNRKTTLLLGILMALGLCIGHVHAMPSPKEGTGDIKEAAVAEKEDAGETQEEVRVKVRSGNARRGPSLDFRKKFRLRKGDSASVREIEGDWFFIERGDGRFGWAHKSLFYELAQSKKDVTESTTAKPALDSPGEPQQIASPPKTDEPRPQVEIKPPGPHLMSVNYIDVDIRKALSTLAMERELNIATAAGVTGKISVHLYQVTVGKALEAIVHAGGFTYHEEGNVYYIYKPKEERDPQTERLELRVFKLKYGEVAKVQEILDALPGKRLVKVHEATKTIVVEDTPENIERIQSIIAFWDRKPKQVMIEAKILEISLNDQMLLGVNWEKILGDVRIGTGGLSRGTLPTTGGVSPVPATGMGIFANVISGAGSTSQFAAALDALRTKTKVNTLSTPKIMAVHGETARVQVGGQRGYRETTLTGTGLATETIKFIPTGTILEITPFVDEENNVLLNVKPSIKSADIQEGIPVVTTTEVSTWLLAKNGETILIGGLIQDTNSNTKNMIPCLGSIPGVGALFGNTDQEASKKELVVLITPQVFDEKAEWVSRNAIEKTRKVEEKFKKGPQPEHKQIFEFLFPPREGAEKSK
jgi:type IV pilus secretin PilQ/predicted competence protein